MDYVIPLLGLAFILFLSLHMAISYENVKDNPIIREMQTEKGTEKVESFNIAAFFTDFTDRVEKHSSEIKIVESTPKFFGGGLALSLLIMGYILTSKRKLINGKEYGTAVWATKKDIQDLFADTIAAKEIKKIKHSLKYILNSKSIEAKEKIEQIKAKYADVDMIFTNTERISMFNYELNNNTLIIGGSGSGKTRGFVMPNILQAHSSYIVTDPKGEILEKSGHFLEKEKGYKIRVLNLDEKDLSNGYNPLYYIHRERKGWEEQVLSLIETIIVNTDGGEKKGGSDPFWDKAERLFLQAVFFFTVEAFPPEECNMNTVMELIRMLDIGEEEDNRNSDLDLFCERFAEKYGSDHIGVDQYQEFRSKASGKTAKSIVISAVARLAPFKVKEVRRIFSYDDMHLEMVGEEKTAIFVVVPPTDKTFNFIAGILFTQLFQELNYCALNVHKHEGQRLPVPCRFILDEFANTCTIPNFVSILAYARSLGIGITTILQSLEQIKNMYKDEWGVIVDNSNTLLYLGKVTHMDTLEYLSKLLGKGTYDKQSSSRTKGRQSSTSISSDRLGRELLDASEIRKIANDKCLFFIGGRNPFYSKKFNYSNHKNYKYTSDGDSKYSYHYAPPEKKILSPHSEEQTVENKTFNLNLTPLIEIVADGEQAVSLLEKNLLNVDFDNDDLVQVSDGEKEDIDLFNMLLSEGDTEEEEMLNISKKIAQIEVVSDIPIVLENIDSLIEELENGNEVDFDSQFINDGEPNDEEEEFEEDVEFDVEEQFDHLIDGELELEEDMGAFLKEINIIDESQLEII